MYRLKQITLLIGDLVCLYSGLLLAVLIRNSGINHSQTGVLISPMSAVFTGTVVIMFIWGLYDIGRLKNSAALFLKILGVAGLFLLWSVIYFYFFGRNLGPTPKTILLLTAVIGFFLILIWRFLYNQLLSTVIWKTTIIFAGTTKETWEVINFLNDQLELGYKISGILTNDTPPENLKNLIYFQRTEDLPAKLAEIVVVSPPEENNPILTAYLYKNLFRHVQVENLSDFYELILKRVPPFTLSETWFLSNLAEQNKKNYDRFRIIIDYGAAAIMGALFVATLPIIAIAIKITSPGPIFFRQKRVGRNNNNFTLIKYRTMRALSSDGSAELNGPQYAAATDSRITGLGKFLRRTRLDELPQFINIFKGQMGLIGPRPERPEFAATLTAQMPYYPVRHLIKPGITGWAQLMSEYYGTIDENLRKLEFDLYYIKNRGPLLDLAIILRTVNIILGMKGR